MRMEAHGNGSRPLAAMDTDLASDGATSYSRAAQLHFCLTYQSSRNRSTPVMARQWAVENRIREAQPRPERISSLSPRT